MPDAWTARFCDGPLAGAEYDRHWAVGPVWEEITLAPVGRGWTIVGGDGIPVYEEADPWPGGITYRLADTARVGLELFAYYLSLAAATEPR